jgi:hypothetical protein
MPFRLPSRRAVGIATAAVLLICFVAWLAVPGIVQSQAQGFVAEKTGHRLTMDKPDFNPFTLTLTLHNANLQEPDGKPLLAFRTLKINISATSLVRAALVFDAIRLDGLKATLSELPGDRLNWSALLDALKGKEDEPPKPAGLPRVDINVLSITDGQVDVTDRRTVPERAVSIDPIDIELQNLSTLPNDQGHFEITARTGFAEKIEWQGEVTLNPLAVSGQLHIDGISVPKLAEMVRLPPGMAPPEGTASVSTHYQIARVDQLINVTLDQLSAKLVGLKLRGKDSATPVLALDTVEARDGKFNLNQQSIALGEITLTGGGLNLLRRADGQFNLANLLQPAPTGTPAQTADANDKPTAGPWHYRISRTAMTDFRATLRDEGVTPAADFASLDVAIAVDGISDDLKTAWPVRASMRARDGGELKAEGTVVAGDPSADIHVALTGLALLPVQPYIGTATTLTLTDGSLAGEGRVTYDARETGYEGSLALQNLKLTESDGKNHVLKWTSLRTRKVAVSGSRLAIGDLVLDGLDTRIIIDADKSTNLGRIMRKPAAEAPVQTAAAPATDAPPAAPYPIAIERLRITNGQLEFADRSLAMPFGTHIHNLHGSLDRLGTVRGTPGQVELDGEVDDYGRARATGEIDLFKPTEFADLKVVFRNVEMTRLTPYAATFAGRRIDSGKLSLDLEYKITKRQLSGENTVTIDTLVLGERVESPQAKNLPLDLAIAILQDADGRIDLGLPVSGNLDDPEFSYGQIVWKAFINVIGKVVTSPFRALGSLFGGEAGMDSIVFEAGQPQLAAPEREKLNKLATALGKRPKLAIEIHGVFAEADRQAMQDLQLRRALAARLDRPVEDGADPGPMPADDPKVQAAIEGLSSERLDRAVREAAKGPTMHATLYEKLRAKEKVTDEQLSALATARGAAALAVLTAAAAPADRVTLLDIERIDATGSEVPLKMDAKVAP